MIRLADQPRYLLFAEAELETVRDQSWGRWRFILQSAVHGERFEATDWEPAIARERLELLTVIRGLEALDQPSTVTLVTPSKYVVHGLTLGMPQWRQTHWMWESFGDLVPISHDDLWRRLDHVAGFHHVTVRMGQSETGDELRRAPRLHSESNRLASDSPVQPMRAGFARRWVRRLSRIASSVIPI